jgi:hypothetical protein
MLLFSFALAHRSGAQAAKLLGSVTDENGVPVGGVEISLRPPGGKEMVADSDDAGHFEEPAEAAGTYLVSLNKPGYFPVTFHGTDSPGRSEVGPPSE